VQQKTVAFFWTASNNNGIVVGKAKEMVKIGKTAKGQKWTDKMYIAVYIGRYINLYIYTHIYELYDKWHSLELESSDCAAFVVWHNVNFNGPFWSVFLAFKQSFCWPSYFCDGQDSNKSQS